MSERFSNYELRWVASVAVDQGQNPALVFTVPVSGPPAEYQTLEEWIEQEKTCARDPSGPGGMIHCPPVKEIQAITLRSKPKPLAPPLSSVSPVNHSGARDLKAVERQIIARKVEEAKQEFQRYRRDSKEPDVPDPPELGLEWDRAAEYLRREFGEPDSLEDWDDQT